MHKDYECMILKIQNCPYKHSANDQNTKETHVLILDDEQRTSKNTKYYGTVRKDERNLAKDSAGSALVKRSAT